MSSPCRRASSTSGARRRPRTSPPTRPCSPWRAWCTSRCSARRGCARRGRPAWPSPPTRRSGSRSAGSSSLFPEQTTFKEFAVDVGRNAAEVDPRGARARRQPRLPARPRLPGPRRRPARRGHREADDRGDRPARRGARGRDEADLREVAGRAAAGSASRSPTCRCRRSRPSSRAQTPPRLPELAEPEVLRHFTELSTRNFGVDTGFYPLGSCTMKYNPRVNERLVGLPGFRDLHPLVDDDAAQGALELEWQLAGDPARGDGPRRRQPPAGRRQPGRADRPAAHARLLRRRAARASSAARS